MTFGPTRPAAVLFDCDGVLADSEGLVNALLADALTLLGWPLSADAARRAFTGLALSDIIAQVEARVGALPADWAETLTRDIVAAVGTRLGPVPGAIDALRTILGQGVPVAVASNAGRRELRAKLDRLGLTDAFRGRTFSCEDVARPKPAPDVYLAAAQACGVPPQDCCVVEDSVVGVRAGIAAGCRVLGLARERPAGELRAAGATPFDRMADLPRLLGLDQSLAA